MQSRPAYHHGDLPAALVRAAIDLLDEQGADADLSLRAVARRAGVSTGAPYRHFADRNALLSAVAAVGYRELASTLQEAQPDPSSISGIADIAVAYVRFALDRPGMFRVMFGGICDTGDADRVDAVGAIKAYVLAVVEKGIPSDAPQAVATAAWAMVHGLAFLFIDGKLDSSSSASVESTVRSSVEAMLRARS